MKKVSIIIPCYNKAKYLSETIESALKQTYKNIEIICFNDYSTDNTSEILKLYKEKNSNIKVIESSTNQGVIIARNTCINIAEGEYILPLDSDDTIEPEFIEKAVKILEENPNIGIVSSRVRLFGKVNKEWKFKDFNFSEMLFKNSLVVTSLFRKSDFITAGGYKEYMKDGYEDWDLWLSFLELGLKPYRINEILFNYRVCDEVSRNSIDLEKQKNLYKIVLKNHIDLYLKNDKFIEKIFKISIKQFKLYKSLVKKFILIIIVEFLLIIILGTILYIKI